MARKKKASRRTGGRKPGRWELVRPEEIRAFRERTGLSRARLAGQLGVSATSVQNWEAGRAATLKTQQRLRDLIDGKETQEAAAGDDLEASAIRTTGSIVAAYLSSQKTALPPAQLASLVRSVREALT